MRLGDLVEVQEHSRLTTQPSPHMIAAGAARIAAEREIFRNERWGEPSDEHLAANAYEAMVSCAIGRGLSLPAEAEQKDQRPDFPFWQRKRLHQFLISWLKGNPAIGPVPGAQAGARIGTPGLQPSNPNGRGKHQRNTLGVAHSTGGARGPRHLSTAAYAGPGPTSPVPRID